MTKNSDGSYDCLCGLRSRPDDRVVIRADTNHYLLRRNVLRTPPGSKVELVRCSDGLEGTLGILRGSASYALCSDSLMIAFSTDIGDLAIVVFENNWWTESDALNSELEILSA